jgi:hypothetical protein
MPVCTQAKCQAKLASQGQLTDVWYVILESRVSEERIEHLIRSAAQSGERAALLIDKSHRIWMIVTVCALVLSTVLYVAYANAAPQGPKGGSWQGLLFGVAGSGLMVFAGLLAGRKKVPRLPIGTARFWLKAHIWLGLLSVPLILFHASFRWGGLLEQALLVVFAMVILSGLAGVAFQQYLPRHMKEATSREAMFEQIPHVCTALRATADQHVVSLCGSLFPPNYDDSLADGGSDAQVDESGMEVLRAFYVDSIRPFLAADAPVQCPLMNQSRAATIFSQAQQSIPTAARDVLKQLASICDERRDLDRQARLHRWLHLWLFVHVPLSMSLLVLGVVHAIMSVYY